jgi:hypothetical protein
LSKSKPKQDGSGKGVRANKGSIMEGILDLEIDGRIRCKVPSELYTYLSTIYNSGEYGTIPEYIDFKFYCNGCTWV